MIQTLISVALAFGAQTSGNTVILDRDVIQLVQKNTGMNVFAIQDDAHFKLKKDHANFVLQIVGQDHEGED